MATFLRNLPSFNKDNFSNFQPENNKYLPKKQSIYACNQPDDAFEQLIVNQRCNLVIQYLEKQAKETAATIDHQSKVARKRDIGQVNSTVAKFGSKMSSDEDDNDNDKDDSTSTKKKRTTQTQIEENMSSFQQAVLMEMQQQSAQATGTNNNGNQQQQGVSNEPENIIEVDDTATNNNDDEIDV